MKTVSKIVFTGIFVISHLALAAGRALPPHIKCNGSGVTAVLRDFGKKQQNGTEVLTANLILTVNGSQTPIALMGFNLEAYITQYVDANNTVAMQLITDKTKLTANLFMKSPKLELEGDTALECADHRAPSAKAKPGHL